MSLLLIRAGGGTWPEVILSGANGTGRPWPSGQNPPRQAVPERAVPRRRLSPVSTACLSETLSSSVSPTHQVLGLIPPCRTPNPLSSLYCRRAEARPGLGCPWALETGSGLGGGTDHYLADAQRRPGGWGHTRHSPAPRNLCTEAPWLVHPHQPEGQNGPVPLRGLHGCGQCWASPLSWPPKRAEEAEGDHGSLLAPTSLKL